MATNQDLTICAAVAAGQHYKGDCVEQGNVCLCISLYLTSQFFSVVPQLLLFAYDFPHV